MGLFSLFCCCDKAPWQRQLIEKKSFGGAYGFSGLESMAIMARSMAAGRHGVVANLVRLVRAVFSLAL